MFKKVLILALGAVMASSSLTGCYFLPDEEEVLEAPSVKAQDVKYTTVTVKKQDVIKQITHTGKIQSRKITDLAFEISGGTIKEISVTVGDKVSKGDLICTLDTGDIDYQIKDKELRIKKATLQKQILAKNKASQAEIDSAQVDIDILQNEYEKLLEQKEDSFLYSTVSGTVQELTSIAVGEDIQVGETVAKIIDTNDLYMAIKPTEINRYKMNQNIVITYNDKEYKGKVYMIPFEMTKQDNEQDYDGEMVYIRFVDAPPAGAIGNVADASLILGQRKNVVAIANKFIKTVNGKKIVYVLNKDGEKESREVETGLANGSHTEIKSGLSEGEEIIIR